MGAAFDVYLEESRGPSVSTWSADEERAFFREWHDRLAPLAKDAPASQLKSQVLGELFALGMTLNDRPAAAAAAEARVELAFSPSEKSLALFQLGDIRQLSLNDSEDDADRAAALAAWDDALESYDSVPVADRHVLMRHRAIEAAKRAASVRSDVGQYAAAAADYNLALELLADVPEEGGMRKMLQRSSGRTALLIERAAAEIRASETDAAAASVAEAAGKSTPPSLVAHAAASKAGLAAEGGTFLIAWLGRAPADQKTVAVQTSLALSLADAGRGEDALPLLMDLREGHVEALAAVPAGRRGLRPHATVLVRLAEVLRELKSMDAAREVTEELETRYPDDKRLYGLQRSVRPPTGAENGDEK